MDSDSHGMDSFGHGDYNSRIDAANLLSEVGIDAAEIDWRKEFISFTAEDATRLAGYRDSFEATAAQIADDFYENLVDFEETTEVMGRSEKGIDQLKETQSAYLVTLARGTYDEEYFRQRARIGKIHDLLDMPMKHYLGQYGVYYDLILPVVGSRLTENLVRALEAADGADAATDGGTLTAAPSADIESIVSSEVDNAIQDILAILRIINLDMQIVADTYIHSYNEGLQAEIDHQQEIRKNVETAVEDATTTASEVAESSDSIRTLAHDQAAAIEDVSSEVATMSATIEEIAATAQQVNATSQRAESLAADGRSAATSAIERMEAVDESTTAVAADVARLEERVDEIDQIVEVINDIADQTNMLALNASIEAARAGEAGDGFAVVADEVKALAEESQDYAGEIEGMVEEIKDDTAQTVASLEATTEQVSQGIEEVEDAMTTLQEIAEAIEETTEGIAEVSTATDDQASSTEQVASMVDDLLDQAQQVAAEIDTVAKANDSQAEQIRDIAETVDQLGTAD